MIIIRTRSPIEASLGFVRTPSIARVPVGFIAANAAWAAVCIVAQFIAQVLA